MFRSTMDLTRCHKTLYICICSFSTSVCSWVSNSSGFANKWPPHLNSTSIHFHCRFWPYCQRHVIFGVQNFNQNEPPPVELRRHTCKAEALASVCGRFSLWPFSFVAVLVVAVLDVHHIIHLGRSTSMCTDQISERYLNHGWDITTSRFGKPIWTL